MLCHTARTGSVDRLPIMPWPFGAPFLVVFTIKESLVVRLTEHLPIIDLSA